MAWNRMHDTIKRQIATSVSARRSHFSLFREVLSCLKTHFVNKLFTSRIKGEIKWISWLMCGLLSGERLSASALTCSISSLNGLSSQNFSDFQPETNGRDLADCQDCDCDINTCTGYANAGFTVRKSLFSCRSSVIIMLTQCILVR